MGELDPHWQPPGSSNNVTVTRETFDDLHARADSLQAVRRWLDAERRILVVHDEQLDCRETDQLEREIGSLCDTLERKYGPIA